MPTQTEKKALMFVAAIAFLGGGVRAIRSGAPPPSRGDQTALDRQLEAVDSARKTGRRKSGPGGGPRKGGVKLNGAQHGTAVASGSGGKLDLDLATEAQIQGLPGIGPVRAKRIVADREAHGPFGSIHALRTVRGIGPKIAARLDSMVTFSGAPRHLDTAPVGTSDTSHARRRRSRARS